MIRKTIIYNSNNNSNNSDSDDNNDNNDNINDNMLIAIIIE